MLFLKSKRQRYADGFAWGKREHNAETMATQLLWVTVILLFTHILIQYKNISVLIPLMLQEYLIMGFLVATLAYRLIAAFAHKREKAHMDKLRF